MKKLALVLMLLCGLALAQNPANIYGVGAAFNPSVAPNVAGFGLYGHQLLDGTYAVSMLDVVPLPNSPSVVTTNLSVGVAQKLATIAGMNFYAPAGVGFTVNGPNVGFQWNGGVMGSVKLKGNYRALLGFRFQKSAVSNGEGYQLLPTVAIAWGQ